MQAVRAAASYRFQQRYLNPRERPQYLARLGVLTSCAAVLTDSASAADDCVQLLGVDRERVTVIGGGTNESFRLPTIGVELSARAGYDPRAAISLWRKMGAQGGASGPEFLSTHPSPATRLADLEVYSARVMPLYEQARRGR